MIAESVRDYPVTLAPAGNSVGKSFCAAGIILWFVHNFRHSKVICTAPTQTQLAEVLWAEVKRAQEGSRIPLAGKVYRSPLKIDKGEDGLVLAYSTTKTERLSGHHATNLLAVIDEGSGVEPAIWEAIDSLNPSRLLVLGNPLQPDGPFYERCMQAQEQPCPLVNLIQISSLESPDIASPRGKRGLADATWLARARNDYGEGSLWWTTHVLGLFPDSGVDTLLSRAWLDRAAATEHRPKGHKRLAIDLSEGKGGDRTVLLVRDDNGVIHVESSNTWSFEVAASKAAILASRYGIEAYRVIYDSSGIGADFGNRLEQVGLKGAQPYRGGLGAGKQFANLRTAAAWGLRQRLDPERQLIAAGGVRIPQPPFSIPPRYMAEMRGELQAIRYQNDIAGRTALEDKEEMIKRLRRSPDLGDTLIISFSFPHV